MKPLRDYANISPPRYTTKRWESTTLEGPTKENLEHRYQAMIANNNHAPYTGSPPRKKSRP